jgi:hypothetical protein
MVKGKIVFAGLIFSGFVMALLANSFSAQAAGNCQSKLVGKSYHCASNEEGIGPDSFTTTFNTGGASADFDMLLGGGDYACSCETTGSVSSPSFDKSSSAFVCQSTFGFMAVGKVSGKKVTGQGTNATGNGSFIFTCTVM